MLKFVGREKVVNLEVESKNLNRIYGESENQIIHADNLLALKSLTKTHRGKIKCIYIDPPYNTGNEGWIYNDNAKDPELARWISEVVGDEKLNRHDKWLCMMYPRLKLMHELLSDDGSMWISIDDDEVDYLKVICDEIFERKNFVTHVIWEKKYSPQNDARWLSDNHDFILVYAKDKSIWRPNLLPRTQAMNDRYKNPDNDPRGLWKATDLSSRGSKFRYAICSPHGKFFLPPDGRQWTFEQSKLDELLRDNRIYFGKNGNRIPSLKSFLSEVKQGSVSKTIWNRAEVGDNQEAKQEIKRFNLEEVFTTPKPVRLIKRILKLATDPNSIILDAFAGSGTTAHATLEINSEDGGNRKFILIESMEYCESITAERIRRINGDFSFYELGD